MKILIFTSLVTFFGLHAYGQALKEPEAVKAGVDLNDINGLLSGPPYWLLYDSYITGKRESVYKDNGYIFAQNGFYLEYLHGIFKEGLWSYNENGQTLLIEFLDTRDTLSIKKLNHDELVFEKTNGNIYAFKSGQYIASADYGLQRRLDGPNSLSVEELKKRWDNARHEERLRQFTIIDCDDFSQGIAVIGTAKSEYEKHYGFINEEGEFIVKPSYEKAFTFSDGYGLVKLFSGREEYLFLNQKGQNSFRKTFQGARSFFEGMAAVRDEGGLWGFINTYGEYIVKPRYEEVDDFADGMARVMQKSKWGYIDNAGNEVVIPQFNCANNFAEGLALVGQFVNYHYTQFSYIGKTGKVAFQINRESSGVFVECCSDEINPRLDRQNNVKRCNFKDGVGVINLSPPNESFLLNKEGKRSRVSQDDVHSFHEGLAVAQKTIGKKYGFIDTKGSWRIDPIFDFASNFKEGLAAVKINNNWGFVDKSGMIVINKEILKAKTAIQTTPSFEGVSDFSEGLAVAVVRGKYGYINREGQWIIKPELRHASPFKNGKAFVLFEKKNGWNYIDKNGKVLFAHFY